MAEAVAVRSNLALRLLTANAPTHAGDAEQIVIAARHGATLTDAAVRSRAEALFAKLTTMPDVTRIVSPYASAGAAQVNRDRTVAFATLTLAKATVDYKPADGQRLIDVARSFAAIYVLIVVFRGPFEELRAKHAVTHALPGH